MEEVQIHEFKTEILKGQEVPEDLQRLFAMQYSRNANQEDYADPLEAIQHYLLKPGEDLPLLNGSYLNDNDRANPDIMANVLATDELFKLITFVAQNDDSDLIGYWHGPEGTAITLAPIVKYDTEGQFSLLQGKNLTEAMLGDYVFNDDDEFAEYREWFTKCGISITASCWDELETPVTTTAPEELHRTLYNRHRVAAGLDAV